MTAEQIRYVAAGGADEIGMNMYLYGYGSERNCRWIAVDCGINFGDPELAPGVERIVPDPKFLQEPGHRLEGVFLTHAHEDHVGAMADLWERLGSPPMFATAFAAEVLRRKFGEAGNSVRLPLTEATPGQRLRCGDFEVAFHSVQHSIPDASLLSIRTPAGLIVHSGDFRRITDGDAGGTEVLEGLGREGVLCLACESTNIFEPGDELEEEEIGQAVETLARQAKGAVIATTFGSNVRRLETLAVAGRNAQRQVIVIGRAMLRMLDIARTTGMNRSMPKWRGAAPEGVARNRLFFLVTGSQGEARAVMSRISQGSHPDVIVKAGDLVLFSSSTVPGNERAVHRVHNSLVLRGARVVEGESAGIHASGHAGTRELKRLYELLKPQFAIPIHGEPRHRAEHAERAREWGAREAVLANNGEEVLISVDGATRGTGLACGRLYCEGKLLLPEGLGVMRERRRMAESGHVAVSVVQNARGMLLAPPLVDMRGAPAEDGKLPDTLPDLVAESVEDALDRLSSARARDEDEVERAVASAVRRTTQQYWGRRPLVSVLVTRIGERA